ncbi:cytochrome d ubiquinol oxidase subunit II [Desulfosporosinus sp. SYSU MS00001]|uniref:cytochrome d ubiquinol oxidase subunit II n=1 Tax=Desulfosporosinus sp. SYSU MS00001 TaxID=3416284 RepID=UPI003CEC2CBA
MDSIGGHFVDLNITWFLLIVLLIIIYIVLDGFDLGVGSLYYVLAKNEQEKRMLIASIGPVWDANEVWLIAAGAALFAAFPLVYTCIFSGLYLPMMFVLVGLSLRAVAVEFRNHMESLRGVKTFDAMFFSGSFIPALLFGVAIGNISRGLPLNVSYYYNGTFWDLLNPYALLFGVVGFFLILLQGITWILLKTKGLVWQRALNLAKPVLLGLLGLIAIATIYTWWAYPEMTSNYRICPILYVNPGLLMAALIIVYTAITRKKYRLAFLGSSLVVVGLIFTLAAGLFPALVLVRTPLVDHLTIYNASSSPLALKVMLIMTLIGLPLVMVYTVYVYRVFRGKEPGSKS